MRPSPCPPASAGRSARRLPSPFPAPACAASCAQWHRRNPARCRAVRCDRSGFPARRRVPHSTSPAYRIRPEAPAVPAKFAVAGAKHGQIAAFHLDACDAHPGRQQVAQLRDHHHPPRTQFVFGWPGYPASRSARIFRSCSTTARRPTSIRATSPRGPSAPSTCARKARTAPGKRSAATAQAARADQQTTRPRAHRRSDLSTGPAVPH
jgi:hypothetical protein